MKSFLGNLCFNDVMFRHFGSKSGKDLKSSRMYRFEAKGNPNAPKHVKLNVIQIGYLIFFNILNFNPQNSKFALQSESAVVKSTV